MSGFISMYHPVWQALGYTVFHSLWQGAVLFFPVQVLLLFCTKAATRYRILLSALSVLFIAFVVTFLTEWSSIVQGARAVGSAVSVADVLTTGRSNPVAGATPWWRQLAHFHQSTAFKRALPAISIGYALGIICLGGRMLLSLMNLRRMRRHLVPAETALQERFHRLAALLSLSGKVELFLSRKVHVPAMFGSLRPVVILPVALINKLDWQQTEALLLHELAHVKRRDFLFNVLQSIMEVLLFFNPIAWWLSGTLRKEREHACDDIVLLHTAQPVKYAEALLQLEYARTLKPALAATGNARKYTLLTRVKRIVEMKTTTSGSVQSILASATILMIIAALICFYAATGQEKGKEQAKAKTYKHTQSYSGSKTSVIVKDKDGKEHSYTAESSDKDMPDMKEMMKTAMAGADSALKSIDWDQISATVSQSVNEVDWNEISRSMKEAMQEIDKIDWDAVGRSAGDAVKHIDWDEIRENIREGLQSIEGLDKAEMQKTMEEVKRAIKAAEEETGRYGFHEEHFRNAETALRQQKSRHEGAMKAAAEAYQEAVKKMSAQKEQALKAAREMRDKALSDMQARRQADIQAAMKKREEALAAAEKQRESVREKRQALISDRGNADIEDLLDRLEKDGLIDRAKKFHIYYKNDRLDVNGKPVSPEPYKAYLEPGTATEMKISGDRNSLSITRSSRL